MDRNRKLVNQFSVDADGSPSYTGAYATFDGTEDDLLTFCRKVAYYDALPILMLIVTGCIPGSGMDGRFQLLMPYAGELIISFAIIGHILKLNGNGIHPKQFEYEQTFDRIPQLAVVSVVAAMAGLIGLGLLLATTGGTTFVWGMVIYGITQAVCAVTGVLIYRYFSQMESRWDKSEFVTSEASVKVRGEQDATDNQR